jgi:hypothetical protein
MGLIDIIQMLSLICRVNFVVWQNYVKKPSNVSLCLSGQLVGGRDTVSCTVEYRPFCQRQELGASQVFNRTRCSDK